LEDWQDRRQYLQSAGAADPRRRAHIKVLDYLISRYGDSPAAHLPARFALRRELHWNDRRISVHHHLGRGEVAGVQDREAAERRIAGLVLRMMSDDRNEDEGFVPTQLAGTPRFFMRLKVPVWRIRLGWNADSQMRRALANHPFLPSECVRHLVSRLTDVNLEDTNALDLLLRCKNRSILECTVRAWRDRVAQGRSTGPITDALGARIRHPDNQPRAAELIRERLADDSARVRIAASRLVAKIGDLDDIGLFSDLLALPKSDDEAPNERDAMTVAMRALAERQDLTSPALGE
jgi:hypothetical protein